MEKLITICHYTVETVHFDLLYDGVSNKKSHVQSLSLSFLSEQIIFNRLKQVLMLFYVHI
jgi:hypothetical protein